MSDLVTLYLHRSYTLHYSYIIYKTNKHHISYTIYITIYC